LLDALDFIQNDLGLVLKSHVLASEELEYVSLQDRSGTYILHWKAFRLPNLHQMTFFSRDEAVYFARAIKKGAYVRSPLGYALLFSAR